MVAMVNERSLTVDEVASALRVSPWTVRIWLRAGSLRGYRPGGTRIGWRVRESALQAFIEQRESQAEDESELRAAAESEAE